MNNNRWNLSLISRQSKTDNNSLMMMPMMTVEGEEGNPDSEEIKRKRRSTEPSVIVQVTFFELVGVDAHLKRHFLYLDE